MEQEPSKIDQLIDHVEEYVKTRQELNKMIAAEKSGMIVSSLVSGIVLGLLFFFVFVFASIALSFGLAQLIGQTYAGFLVVAAFYLLIGVVLTVKKEKWLKSPVANAVVRNFFKEQHE